MFVIVTYDINKKRVSKVKKVCQKYLNHVQLSVFEGNITESKLNKLKQELSKTIKVEIDQICIYQFDSLKYARKEQIGYCKVISNII